MDGSVATDVEVSQVVNPETATQILKVGGRDVQIVPLVRRWQKVFDAAALPLFEAELSGAESIIKAIGDGSVIYSSIAGTLIESTVKADALLDRAAAVILASRKEGAEKDVEVSIKEQIEFLQAHARTEEMLALVEAQVAKEKLLFRVGERFPVRFSRLLNLAGIDMTADSLKQFLNSLLSKLPATLTGDGSLTMDKSSGSSSAT